MKHRGANYSHQNGPAYSHLGFFTQWFHNYFSGFRIAKLLNREPGFGAQLMNWSPLVDLG